MGNPEALDALSNSDLSHVVRRIPKDVREILSKYPNSLFLGGGYIRAVIAGETPNDIDLFGVDATLLLNIAKELQSRRGGKANCLLHQTKNAITLISNGRLVVQFITRWTYKDIAGVVASFDFTVCQAAICRSGPEKQAPWISLCSDRFYHDLAARRIVYTYPIRDEEAGGSLMRALKYQKRGYVIQIESLAGVVSRLIAKIDPIKLDTRNEAATSHVLRGLLQEVDPSIAVDGLEVSDDHETPIDGLDYSEAPL